MILIRLFLTFFILQFIKLPLFYKLILIILTDLLDSKPHPKNPLYRSCPIEQDNHTNDFLYQISDKIADLFSYYMILLYLYHVNFLPKKKIQLLFQSLLFRTIGVICFIFTEERSFLFFFPNLFLEFCLFFLAQKRFQFGKRREFLYYVVIFVWKFLQEYYLHVYIPNTVVH